MLTRVDADLIMCSVLLYALHFALGQDRHWEEVDSVQSASNPDQVLMLNIGERLHTARKERNLSLRELAAKAEVSASLLSQIENERANPSVESLFAIATALAVPIHYFFPFSDEDIEESIISESDAVNGENGSQEPTTVLEMTSDQLRASQEMARLDDTKVKMTSRLLEHTPVLRANQRAIIELMGGVIWSRLTPHEEHGIEFLEVYYEVDGSSGPARSRHSGREFGLVLEGKLKLELGFEEYLLEEGDSAIFNSAIPHRLSNVGDVPMRAVWVNIDHY